LNKLACTCKVIYSQLMSVGEHRNKVLADFKQTVYYYSTESKLTCKCNITYIISVWGPSK